MESKKEQVNLYTSLPQKILSGPNLDNKDEQTDHITAILKETLPPRERNTIIQELNWHFTLEKQAAEKCKNILKKQKRRKRIKKQPLHGIEKPTTGWCYQELIPVRDMWREYIKRCIGGPVKEENNSLRVILGKCEFIGGDVTVEKALSAGCVGMNGIVIKETQKMFGIVNKNSKYQEIPKDSTVLTFDVGSLQFTVIGKHIMTRPAERSVKKIKSILFADI